MNKEELIKFLKENLEIQIQVNNLGIEVRLYLEDKLISTDYDSTN